MYAARAGAGKVVAVEATSTMAKVAQVVTRKHGFGRAVDVVNAFSHDVVVRGGGGGGGGAAGGGSATIGTAADVLVAEIFDYQLLGERALTTFADAFARGLVKKDAVVVPARATVWAQLVNLHDRSNVAIDVGGGGGGGSHHSVNLDVWDTYQRELLQPSWQGVRLEEHAADVALTAPFKAAEFDFSASQPPQKLAAPCQRVATVTGLRDGSWNAVVYWYHLHLDDEAVVSTGPGASRAWTQALQYMTTPLPIRRGETTKVVVVNDAQRIVFVDAEQRAGPAGGPSTAPPPPWFARYQRLTALTARLGAALGIRAPGTPLPRAVFDHMRHVTTAAALEHGVLREVVRRVCLTAVNVMRVENKSDGDDGDAT